MPSAAAASTAGSSPGPSKIASCVLQESLGVLKSKNPRCIAVLSRTVVFDGEVECSEQSCDRLEVVLFCGEDVHTPLQCASHNAHPRTAQEQILHGLYTCKTSNQMTHEILTCVGRVTRTVVGHGLSEQRGEGARSDGVRARVEHSKNVRQQRRDLQLVLNWKGTRFT